MNVKVQEKIMQEKTFEQIVSDAYEAGHVFSESEIRDLVGAPTELESEYCVCGELLNTCNHAYEHMTHGY